MNSQKQICKGPSISRQELRNERATPKFGVYLHAYMQSIYWEVISESLSFFWRHSVIESLSGW